jgi:dTDP-4-dehydrorhamnose reductase/dTDP-4-dehydrorhamnose 3,5-epimerase
VFSKDLKVTESPIPGLFVIDLPVHADSRGWFKENYQAEKLAAAGLPHFRPVQNNISFNGEVGTIRGFHAEPWEKYVSVATGKVFAAWVDLREGKNFGQVFSIEIDPSIAVFVPSGVANAFQALEKNTTYTYLVSKHWSADAKYSFINLADASLGINWPISLEDSGISDKDKKHPLLKEVEPVKSEKYLVIGSSGQLAKSLRKSIPQATFLSRRDYDLSDIAFDLPSDFGSYKWVINAAAFTDVDGAESAIGRKSAWSTNVHGLASLVAACKREDVGLVHVSSDYVFDGESNTAYLEEDKLCPLGVYGQTKAAGEVLVATLDRHQIIRTSWVVGEGKNFVSTMKRLASENKSVSVVDDQIGRLTFADDLANAIKDLLQLDFIGVANVSNSGVATSWYQIAKRIYENQGRDSGLVNPVSTPEYLEGKPSVSPRPKFSVLSLAKLESLGISMPNWEASLSRFLGEEQ